MAKRALLHRDRCDQLHHNLDVVPGITISGPPATPPLGHIRGAKVELRPIPLKNSVCRPPSSFVSTYTSASNFVCGLIRTGLAQYLPALHSSLRPRSSTPRCPRPPSSSFLNISTPARRKWRTPRSPLRRSPSHPRAQCAPSYRAAAAIENTSSTGIKNALDRPLRHRNVLSSALTSLIPRAPQSPRIPLEAFSAEPVMIGVLSPGSCKVSRSRTQALPAQQLRVIHHVTLFKYTTMYGTPTWRAGNVLARLRHRAVRRRDHQYRPVHLRRSRDHVLHVVRMPGQSTCAP